MTGLLFASAAMAQTQKGNGLLSGNISTNYSRQESPSGNVTTTWLPAITLTGGRFWSDNWLAGLSASSVSTFGRQQAAATPNLTYISNSIPISVTPFFRRYWQVNSVYLFAGAGLSVNIANSKQPSFDSNGQPIGVKSSSWTINPRLEAGATYFVTNRLSLQLLAATSSLPLSTASLSAGLVYWTGSDRHADTQEERTNVQTDPGKWVLEGGFSINNQKNSHSGSSSTLAYQSSNSTYSFNPSVGFFVKKNSLFGITIPISYNFSKTENSSVPAVENVLWGVGVSPYFQHYWASTRLTPYTRVNAGYTHYNSESFKANNVNGGLTIGLAYMAGERFIIETSLVSASVDYLTADGLNGMSNNKIWTAGISAGLTGNFAIRYVLQ
ncbi:hypothetical protein BH09BAC4_BH09BAC4_37610 [soil metagenome]